MTPDTSPHRLLHSHLAALATVCIWSFSFLFIVMLAVDHGLTPLGVVVGRKEIFAVMVVGLLLWRRPNLRALDGRSWTIIVGLGIVGGPMYHMIFAWSAGTHADGSSRIDPGLLGLILATVPVHTGWLGWLLLKEKLTTSRIIALAFGLAGATIVVWGRHDGVEINTHDLVGPLAALIAAVVAGGIAVLMRRARTILAPLDLIAVSGAVIVLLCVPFHPWAHMDRVWSMNTTGWIALGFLGVFGSGIAFITWAYALRGLQAVTAAMYLFAAAVLAALWAWLFTGTPIGWPFVAGSVLVLTGLLTMARAARPVVSPTTPSSATGP